MKNILSVRVGIVQMDVKLGDVDSNIISALEGLRQLAGQGTKIAVLPEMWSCGFDNPNLRKHADRTPEILAKLSAVAAAQKMMIAGSMPESVGEGVCNTTYLIGEDGVIAGEYRKIHLFTPTQEDRYFVPGRNAVVCETALGKFGLMTCYDLRFPELCRSLTDQGAQVVLVSAQWPGVRIGHWDILLRARAIENQIFIVAANRCGKESRVHFPGHSQIVSPLGEVMVMADENACVLHADLHYDELQNARNAIPCLKERVFEAYRV